MTMISVDHDNLLRAAEAQAEPEVWRATTGRGVLDEAAITGSWLPTAPAWEDVSAEVTLDGEVGADHDGRGYALTLTVAEESRLEWADDLAVAIVARAWDGAAWQARTLVAWGYLDGSGAQRVSAEGDQTGRRGATYHGYWGRLNVPSHRFGRRNLAESASVAASTPALASVTAEAPLEYVSQDDNAPEKALDGNADTVYVGDIVADPARPALGSTLDPRILRAYAGRATRVIGAGNQPIWVELFAGYDLAPWGTTWTSPPAMYGGNTATVRDDATIQTTVITYGDGSKGLRVTMKLQAGNPNAEGYISWTVGGSYPDRPWRVAFDLFTLDAPSVGKQLMFWATDSSPAGSSRADINPIAIPSASGSFEVSGDSTGNYGGIRINFKALKNQLNVAAITFDIKNLRASIGYNDAKNAGSARLFLSYDDGLTALRTQRIWEGLTGSNFVIPADGTVIVTDDAETFRARFDPGNRLVLQMKNLQPEWFFGPAIGKLALRYGNDPNRLQFNPAGMTTIETIDFTTNGLSWTPDQAVSRQGPIGTGALTVETFPHVGTQPGAYGGGYLWLDLGAYQPTRLALPITSGQLFLVAEDSDLLTPGMEAVIGTERVLLGALIDGTFVIARAQGGTTAAAHNAGDTVTPRLSGATQTGPRWDLVTVARKPGTPPLRSGVILYSNLLSPGDPSTGGSLWERHPDWTLLSRFENSARADSLDFRTPGGVPVQARHVLLGDALMHRQGGAAQRFKLNEIVVREYVPGASSSGDWAGHASSDQAAVAAHLLTQHGGVPASKIAVAARPAPLGSLPVVAAPLGRMIDNLESDAALRVWLDPTNAATIGPDPASPQYDAREVYVTIDASRVIGGLAGDWGLRSVVAQVRGLFTDPQTLRSYAIDYPDVPGRLGETVEIRGTVRSWQEGRDRVEREYRARNVRRTPQRVVLNAAPWARPWLRVVYSAPDLDAGGQWTGINCVVVGFRHRFFADDAGGAQWETELTLREVIL